MPFAGKKTRRGLRVRDPLDSSYHETGITVTKDAPARVNFTPAQFHGGRNCTIHSREKIA
jgi:hypothetical protein